MRLYPCEVEPLAVVGLEVRVGRLLAESAEGLGEVAVEDHQRVSGLGVLVEPLGEQDVGAQVHRPAPELREPLALELLVLDVLGRGGSGIGGMTLSSVMAIVPGGRPVDGDLAGRAVEVAGRLVPLLPLAAVHRQLDDVPVGAVEGLVPVQQGLDAVVPGGTAEALERVSEGRLVDHGLLTRGQAVNVDAEDLLGPGSSRSGTSARRPSRWRASAAAGRRAACRPARGRSGPRSEARRPPPRPPRPTRRSPRSATSSAGNVDSCSWSGHPRRGSHRSGASGLSAVVAESAIRPRLHGRGGVDRLPARVRWGYSARGRGRCQGAARAENDRFRRPIEPRQSPAPRKPVPV